MGKLARALALLALAQPLQGVSICPDTGPDCPHCRPNQWDKKHTNPRYTWVKDGKCKHCNKGDHCPITCEPGYEAPQTWQTPVLGAQITRGFKCGSDHQWHSDPAGQALDCQLLEGWCGGDPDASHGVVLTDPYCKRRIGDTCDADCAKDFRRKSGRLQYTCQADKTWAAADESHPLQCERVCPQDPEPFAGFRYGCNHTVGSQCDAQCDPGYSSTSQSMKYTCSGKTGGWVPATAGGLRCQLHGCADEVVAPHTERCESVQQGATCITKCAVGYNATGGSPVFSCARDGTWQPDRAEGPLQCTAIPDFCAGDPGNVSSDHIQIDPNEECVRVLGHTCVARCVGNTAQMPLTDLEYMCVQDDVRRDHGRWVPTTDSPLSCALLCPYEQPPNPYAEFNAGCEQLAQRPQAACIATCRQGYRQVGGIRDYTCNPKSGQWEPFESGEALVCEKDCADGQAPNASDPTQCSQCAPGLSSAGIKCINCSGGVWLDRRCQPKPQPSSSMDKGWWSEQSEAAQVSEIVFVVFAAVVACWCWSRRRARKRSETAGVLRESFLGADNDCFFIILGASVCVVCAVFLVAARNDRKAQWDTLCLGLTALSVLCIPWIIRQFHARLQTHDVVVPRDERTSGWLGLIMFIHGICDLVVDGYLCWDIFRNRDRVLLGLSFAANLIVSTLTTWYLSITGLVAIEKASPPTAREWHIRNNAWMTALIFASSCRIESLAISRLSLCGRTLSHFPIADKYFHFLRYSGWFHAILADIPHVMVAIALLLDDLSEDSQNGEEDAQSWKLWLPEALSIFFSSGSIVWGFVSRAGQWAVAQAGPLPSVVGLNEESLSAEVRDVLSRPTLLLSLAQAEVERTRQESVLAPAASGSQEATISSPQAGDGPPTVSRHASPEQPLHGTRSVEREPRLVDGVESTNSVLERSEK